MRKISKKDREGLLDLLEKIIAGDKSVKVRNIKNSDFFRARYKNFQVIFHKEKKEIIINSIRLHNEKTYKNLK